MPNGGPHGETEQIPLDERVRNLAKDRDMYRMMWEKAVKAYYEMAARHNALRAELGWAPIGTEDLKSFWTE